MCNNFNFILMNCALFLKFDGQVTLNAKMYGNFNLVIGEYHALFC